MRLRDELVHLRVRRQMDDDVDLGVRDAADPVREGRVLAGQILEQVAEVVRPGVHALVDAEDLVAVGQQPEREVGADLPGRAGDQDALDAATAVRCAPPERGRGGAVDQDVDELARLGVAGEVDRDVAARAAAQQAVVRPARTLDEHLLDGADALGVSLGGDALDDLDEPLEPLVLDLLGHLVGHRRPPRSPRRGE